MHRVNQELGELISAIGTPWFSNTLPAVIRYGFNYDFFLLASYEKNQPLHIIRSDFQEVEMQQTLHYLTTETYVAEPIFRLFNAGKTTAGVFDMDELVARSLALPERSFCHRPICRWTIKKRLVGGQPAGQSTCRKPASWYPLTTHGWSQCHCSTLGLRPESLPGKSRWTQFIRFYPA